MLFRFFLIIPFAIFLVTDPIFGQEEPEHDGWHLDHFKFALGAEYLSNLQKRGATLYDSYQVIPIYSAEIFSKNLVAVGTSLNFKHQLSNRMLYRAILNLNATGDEPLYETGEEFDKQIARDKTTEVDQRFEYGLPMYGEVYLHYSKDVAAHWGSYTELGLRAVLVTIETQKLNWQASLTATVGGGNKFHNRYLYGANARYGSTNYSLGVSLAAPPAIDHYFPVVEVKHYKLAGAAKNGVLVADKQEGVQVIALFAVKVF
jgi:hypothetical protein